MKNLTNLALLLCLAGGAATQAGCASDSSVSSADPAKDPYPWCADQRREAADRMPTLSNATAEELEKRDRYVDAHVAKDCQQPLSPTHP
ncbi:hypothetical protein [Pseudoxanthomonas indica]|uniref:Entry exclusion lipoprotein TrbK n=1 Tax=Pseudoxanthomonas indica TaxID=428993 RepID=A0A1T5J4E0_9GAMM|nr:hypothetical protein [Pseudoxanthomonas indica]GGD56291.1 hypothetical protein GCM10007235_30890 [Pseudoxanthomonas indica]SKC46244.1 hypothetical protein SAMN06296058_0514 [Pseudoxanthomonas indica]